MTLFELQSSIAATLNADTGLTAGGCFAFAEDSLSVVQDVDRQLQEAGGVAIVVSTPDSDIIGEDEDGDLEAELPTLTVSCMEHPALNRATDSHLTALAAAQAVLRILASDVMLPKSIRQNATGQLLTADAVFSTHVTLTQG